MVGFPPFCSCGRYRLGYELVTQQAGQGLGVVAIGDGAPTGANATWLSEISPLHDYYMTMDRVPSNSRLARSHRSHRSSHRAASNNGNHNAADDGENDLSDVFVSLAPRAGTLAHDLDLVQWTDADGGKSAKVIAALSNAHVPSVAGLGTLGCVRPLLFL